MHLVKIILDSSERSSTPCIQVCSVNRLRITPILLDIGVPTIDKIRCIGYLISWQQQSQTVGEHSEIEWYFHTGSYL